MEEMTKTYKHVRLLYVEYVESDLNDILGFDDCNTIVVLHPMGSENDRQKVMGVDEDEVTDIIKESNDIYKAWFDEEKIKVSKEIEEVIAKCPIFIFIKGTKEKPYCKFSKALVKLLQKYDY